MKIPATISCGILQERCGKVTVSRGKAPEIPRKWKQYSGRKFFGCFPVNSCQLPVVFGRKRSEIIREKAEKVPVGIVLPSSGVFPVCFRCVPVECAGNTTDPVSSCRTSLPWGIMARN